MEFYIIYLKLVNFEACGYRVGSINALFVPNFEEEKVEQGECVDLMRPDRLCLALDSVQNTLL
jgi:hypothetical protein